jgi:hypothetical protein
MYNHHFPLYVKEYNFPNTVFKHYKNKSRAGGMSQMVEQLPGNCEV